MTLVDNEKPTKTHSEDIDLKMPLQSSVMSKSSSVLSITEISKEKNSEQRNGSLPTPKVNPAKLADEEPLFRVSPNLIEL